MMYQSLYPDSYPWIIYTNLSCQCLVSFLLFLNTFTFQSNLTFTLHHCGSIFHQRNYIIHPPIWLTSFSACLSALSCRSKVFTASIFARSADRFAQLFRRLLDFCARTVAVFFSFQFLPTWELVDPIQSAFVGQHDRAPISAWDECYTWYSIGDRFNNASFSNLDILIFCSHGVDIIYVQ